MTGIRKTAKGWQAFVRVDGAFRSKRYPPTATLTEMKQWREEQRVRARIGSMLPAQQSTLAEDVRHYLEQVATMPSLRFRRDDLALWLEVFGKQRDRRTITAGEIRAQLERWRADYAPSTVNHRRTALMHLWTILDGKTAQNPARDVARYREAPRPPRALPLEAITALLSAMQPSVTRARLELMAWTGWPHTQIMRLEPGDIAWERAVYIRPRQKGAGVAGRWLPLLPQGWKALHGFKRAGAWGAFSTSSMRKSLRLAASHVEADKGQPKAIRAAVADITPYDLRHSFLTMVALHSRNPRAVMDLGLHGDLRQGLRYTEAATNPLTLAALDDVTAALGRKLA